MFAFAQLPNDLNFYIDYTMTVAILAAVQIFAKWLLTTVSRTVKRMGYTELYSLLIATAATVVIVPPFYLCWHFAAHTMGCSLPLSVWVGHKAGLFLGYCPVATDFQPPSAIQTVLASLVRVILYPPRDDMHRELNIAMVNTHTPAADTIAQLIGPDELPEVELSTQEDGPPAENVYMNMGMDKEIDGDTSDGGSGLPSTFKDTTSTPAPFDKM